jgi:Alpha-glutamyl/putrescinyl thymine pyrophosphorylase clade 3
MSLRPSDVSRAIKLNANLVRFDSEVERLLGIRNSAARAVLVEQIVESLRRIEFVHVVRDGEIDPRRAVPDSHLFDPIRAAAFWMRKGKLDEVFWLVFLSTHFGKHVKHGWGLTRAVYGGSNGQTWTWKRVSQNVGEFRRWLSQNEVNLKEKYAFSNHRKYQSLSAYSKVGTGAVVESYVKWVTPPRTHLQMIQELHKEVGQDPRAVFDSLYQSMESVTGFGRLGKFDFLTMLGKLGAAPIEPGSAYLVGATGPLQGARLLFTNNPKAKLSPRDLDARLAKLGSYLHVGMQVLEDSLCNWQKSPKKFKSFRG